MQPLDVISKMVFKRCIDISISLVAIIALLPTLVIISICVKKDGGTVFFASKRIGRRGKEFYCLKFRTMVPNANEVLEKMLAGDAQVKSTWETHRKIKNDQRITAIGNFLRTSSMDELPQLLNVLKGDMSIVGPRPILPDEMVFFSQQQLQAYCSVKPGITGLWQVSGRNQLSFQNRVDLDINYINNWSIWRDVVIMCKTFFVVIKRTGAY